jgi:THAP4-like, heme-binding beta-barrel domain
MAGVPLHPEVAPLGFLLGSWSGEGEGDYPTVEGFGYREEAVFWHVGKPYLGYNQRTWARSDGRPSHSETGFWRCGGEGRIELVAAHPNGLVEVSDGRLVPEGPAVAVIAMESRVMAGTSTAKDVSGIGRTIPVEGDELSYTLEMAAVGIPLSFHLRARLRRKDATRETGETGETGER